MNSIYFEPPDHWTRTPIKALVDGPDNGAWGDEPGLGDIDVVCARVADFEWEHLTVNLSNPTIRSIKRNQFNRLALRNGDLLIEKSGGGEKTPVGRVVAFSGDVDAITSNFVARMRPKPGFSPDFLKYLFAAHYLSGFTYQFIKQATGIQNLDDKPLMQVVAWVPDPENQDTIARFLDRETGRIDGLIEKKTRFIALLKEKRTADIIEAISPKEGWSRFPFWSVAKPKSISGRPDEGLLSVYLDRGVIPYSEGGGLVHKPAESLEKYQLVEPGDLVMNNQQAWRGSLGVSLHRGIVSPAYLVLKLDREKIDPTFANYMFRARPYVEKFMLSSMSVGDIQRQIKWPHLRIVPVVVPSVEEQRKIAERLDNEGKRIDDLIALTERSIDLLREKRAALITAAVTGKIDVRTAA